MRSIALSLLLTASTFFLTCSARAQGPIGTALKMGFTDVAETKRKAEAGGAAAQLSLANTFAGQLRPADAVPWYQKAASQGSLEAVHKLGNILLTGDFFGL